MRKWQTLILVWFLCALAVISAKTQESWGTIAFIGEDGNVYSQKFGDATIYQLSRDAVTSRPYQWLTWSNDGRLAYFCCDLRQSSSVLTKALVSQDGQQEGETVFSGMGENILYAAWSPANCDTDNCRDLAMLVSDVFSGRLRLDVVRQRDERSVIATIAQGSPFYFSWKSDGQQLLFHRNGRAIEVFDMSQLSYVPDFRIRSMGNFQSPSWSPDGSSIVAAIPLQDASAIATFGLAGDTILQDNLRGFLAFLWSPDGRYLAYRSITNERFGELMVIDALTGALVTRSRIDNVLAFFWSPDSQKLAYITPSDIQGFPTASLLSDTVQNVPLSLSWSTLNLATGLNRRLADFIPTYETQYLLSYFDQFAQSHRVWSPDSQHIVFGALNTARNQAEIRILTVETAEVDILADGTFGVWSFN